MAKMLPILSEVSTNSVDYELTGTGGYGELKPYDGTNLNQVSARRGFKTIITPQEYSISVAVGFKQAKIDKLGETKKVGTRLGDSAGIFVYTEALKLFSRAFNSAYVGGDGKAWAATDHPVASKYSEGREYVADTDAGTYSNLITSVLSVKAISDAQAAANRFVTPDGQPFLCDYDCVLIAPELEETAKKLFGENSRLMPDKDPETANNAANPVYGMSYIVIGGGTHGFTAKQWAVCDKTLMKELVNIVYITRPKVMQSGLDNPLIDMYTAYVDFSTGWGDARQIIFSNPA
jgi:hypothetical protein